MNDEADSNYHYHGEWVMLLIVERILGIVILLVTVLGFILGELTASEYIVIFLLNNIWMATIDMRKTR